MKRNLLSILLALCMMLTLFPSMALAEEPAAHANHNVCCCGDTGCTDPNHSEHTLITDWQVWPETGLPTDSGNYYLTDNVTISSQWKIENGKNIVLCLNGKTLTADNAAVADTILIEGTLTITDCVGTGKITGTNTSSGNNKAIQVTEGGTLNLYAGSITGINAGGGSGGGVHNRGTFNMYGGAITNNTAKKGGGVLNWGGTNPAIFNMYGGTISGNTSTNSSYTDGNDIYNQVDGGQQGVMNAYGGTVAGTVKNLKSTITTPTGSTTATTFNGAVMNAENATISGGTFNGTVVNASSGATISGGTYNGAVTNNTNATISGGTFNGSVFSTGTLSGSITNNGTFTVNGNIPDDVTLSGSGNVAKINYDSTTGTTTTWSDNSGAALTDATANVSSEAMLENALNASNVSTIKLSADVTLTNIIQITDGREITIDLNGHTITFEPTVEGGVTKRPYFRVSNGTLNLTGSGTVKEEEAYYAPVIIKGSDNSSAAYTTVVNVGKNVTLEGWAGIMIDQPNAYGVTVTVDGTLTGVNDTSNYPGAGIYINGSIQGTTGSVPLITLSSTSKVSGSGYGIYAAGYAKWTIAGTVSGKGGIEAKAGVLDITGGSITATATTTAWDPNINGGSTTGYGIAAVNNAGYAGNPTITIANCNVTGKVAIEDDDEDPTNNRATLSITGGTFSQDPTAYVASGYIVMKDGGKFTVVTNSGLTSGTYLAVPSVASGYYYVQNDDNTYTVYYRASSGGSSNPTYTVSAPKTDNGSVSLSPKSAKKGASVTITVTPDSGYTLETLTVLDKNGNEIELTDNGDGTYSFKMPAGKVEVKATFMEDNSMLSFFTDVTADSYYYDAVLWAAKNGITGGIDENHFGPGLACTRAQLVTFLWRAAGCPVVNSAMDFSDVGDGYYTEAIRWAASLGIVGGYGNGLFGSDDTITREQFVTILYRFAKNAGMDVSIGESTNILSYGDALDVSEYAVEAFQWATGAGIVQGNNGNLMPNQPCTRAQIVTMLYRLLGN